MMMCVPKCLNFLQLNYLNLEFSSIFSYPIEGLEYLELKNKGGRKKVMDENEIKSLKQFLPNLKSIKFYKFPLDDNQILLMLSK